jgi:toxin ParE1/3/4
MTEGLYRLTRSARADIRAVLEHSAALHGYEARVRYEGLIFAALQRVANAPNGRSTVGCGPQLPDVRSYHIRHSRAHSPEGRVANPVHVVYYRPLAPGQIEIVRVLHERMDPGQHVAG